MIVELGLAIVGTYAYNYLNTIDERKLKHKFTSIMESIGVQNKKEESFRIYKTIPTSYGYVCYVNIPNGLSIEHLNSKINILEDNLNGIIDLEKDKFKPHITMRIVDRDIAKFPFEPVKCSSNKIPIGKDFKGKNFFIDLNKDPHIVIGGATGTGKSFALACMLSNLIYYSSNDIELYMSQIVKGDISAFSQCKPVKFVAYNTQEVIISLQKVCKILDDRAKLFMDNGIRNITQWNTHFKNRHMKRIIYVLEELSFFIDELDIWEMILKIAKTGRSVGIHLLSTVQRSTATNIPPDFKSQVSRITFRQKSSIDSINIINTTEATKLKERECIFDGNSDTTLVKVPYIDEDFIMLHKYIPEIKIPSPNKSNKNKSKKDTSNTNDIEILNIDTDNKQILTLEQHIIVDIDEKDIKQDKIKPSNKFKSGTIPMEEYRKCSQKEIRKF